MKLKALAIASTLLLAPLATSADEIDFEGLATGTILSSVNSSGGAGPIFVNGVNPDLPGQNAAVVFDTANPTGDDFDLGTPNTDFGGPGIGIGGEIGATYENDTARGKSLIVDEYLAPIVGGLVANPDDAIVDGSSLTFDFSALGSVTMESIFLIDVEQEENAASVDMYDGGNNLLSSVSLPQTGDNGATTVSLGSQAGVVFMVVNLNGSGSIDSIVFNQEQGGGEGCTPGYWKQPHHFDSWVGYLPTDLYFGVFGVDSPSLTLLDALQSKGGKKKALRRHATAALLNAASSVDYAFSTAQIIAMVQSAYASGSYNAAKNLLAAENEQGCPLN